jgi:transitional endoplasmic reticulum ATPase
VPGGYQPRSNVSYSIGHLIGAALGELWRGVLNLGRAAQGGFHHSSFNPAPGDYRGDVPRTKVRAAGFILIGFLGIAWLLFLSQKTSPALLTPGGILLSPFVVGIAIAGLWSFPATWSRMPLLLQKALLIVLLVVVPVAFLAVTSSPVFWRFGSFFGLAEARHGGILFAGMSICWAISFFAVLFSKKPVPQAVAAGGQRESAQAVEAWSNVPATRFADVGGMEEAKRQIRRLVENRLHPEKFERYRVVQNGILLHGPRGTGKTFLAEATAGEFGLNFFSLSPTNLVSKWVGETDSNIRDAFSRAAVNRPVLLFIDEIDSIGSARQELGRDGDSGGGGRARNSATVELMKSIDAHRAVPGVVIMAATNLLDAIDPALLRDGRFDLKLRVDLPSEEARASIFRAQLSSRPSEAFAVEEFARKTVGTSAAGIKAIVDRAAALAAEQQRRVRAADIESALEESGGRDRPLFQAVDWSEVVITQAVESELRTLIQVLNQKGLERLGIEAPTGLLLIGPPGTGKTMLARLIATQTRRSFYPITPADVLSGSVGGSVKKMAEVFGRAKEYGPSIVFLDELDGLLPRNPGYLSSHDVQLVEQTLMEISKLEPAHHVFLIGTTNGAEHIDARVLRGGRFSEKIEIGLPDSHGYRKLLARYLSPSTLAEELSVDMVVERLAGLTPADLEAVCKAAKRFAFQRMPDQATELPSLIRADFDAAVARVLPRT